ncbi:hypothetical protein [Paracoccus lutimaris]|nr:hypothetical protein [Paracoccus lutimaris]
MTNAVSPSTAPSCRLALAVWPIQLLPLAEFQLIRILTMRFAAEDLLSALLEATPRPTAQAPRDARGLYGLVDHHGDLRYIGSTSSTDQTFYERIHQRHRTGSEGMSHYFSQMYNTGRMWRDRSRSIRRIRCR